MTRYEREFEGIPSDASQAGGMDPNYRDGYRGMRMRAGPGQAAYGAHRLAHQSDLETAGGFGGIHGPMSPGRGNGELLGDVTGSGGVHHLDDPEFLKDFNSRSGEL